MFYISEIKNTTPSEFKTELQKIVYATLHQLGISYKRVHTDKAISMEDSLLINEKLDMQNGKNAFPVQSTKKQIFTFL
ncbi:YbaK/EbsC family protein [Flavobacterium gawalongense]|uniref:Uncharacterized protein n=1 Tax=Flavobacterium gawalongense TaxID=2594432 RepID=A0A553BIW7_9FLAO|nr:hypothetical protein [Flavobacterium gawalongense]TRX00087.1 hypothetical protein FNW33_13365 [Flavobacterium gawalongense]TRX04820.1 hypothetical protein FNW12_12840 [Flavobacterium gawalongense]TRX08185.1 hypothetical protein FNW11_11755 [Flavobacterium gawalongense]TRX08759.1 hypothetical protein FNW10_12270 [Flavobacterium gawalongense]TRX24687.1 hypothetical protein FNW38_12825 [Flavobacterium gawalongense]